MISVQEYSEREAVQPLKVEGIQQSQFRKLAISFPVDIKEQLQIKKMLNELIIKINNKLSYLNKLSEIKKGLMQDLLIGKVKVIDCNIKGAD